MSTEGDPFVTFMLATEKMCYTHMITTYANRYPQIAAKLKAHLDHYLELLEEDAKEVLHGNPDPDTRREEHLQLTATLKAADPTLPWAEVEESFRPTLLGKTGDLRTAIEEKLKRG